MKSALHVSITGIALLLPFLFANPAMGQTPIVFEYTGEVETYVVPSCVAQIEVTLQGAEGGGPNGGSGSTITGIIDVVEGQVLEIRVGGEGDCPGAGFNGGGSGGSANNNSNAGCGGGGASDVRSAPYQLDDRIASAAGGGGMGGGNTDAEAGVSGCASGGDGDSPFGQGGGGATANNGGAGGPPWIGSGNNGTPGNLGNGGNGAIDPCYNVGPGGGGGGGKYGGGGGGSDCFASGTLGGGGGGGGSSLTPTGFTCTGGNVSGNGSITIVPLGGIGMTIEPLNPQYCEGDSLFLNLAGADNYEWLEADGLSTFEGPDVWVSPDTTTIYSVIASNEECLDTVEVTVTVVPYPVLTVDPVYATSCNEPIQLFATGAFQLAWTPVETLSNGYGPFTTATPTETTTYTVTGTNQGCSSTETITIAYQLEVESTEYFCEGGSYSLPDGTDVEEEGTYIANYVSTEGCDSIVTVNLIEQSTYDFQMPVQLCAGETFTLPDGTIINEPGTYPVTMETALAQCDSAITTVVAILQPFETQTTLALCEGEPVELGDGTIVTEEGVYVTVLTSLTNGCDSTVTSNVIYQPNYDVAVSLEECDDGSYLFPDGTLPTNSGVFGFELQTLLGCDSSVTIDLTLNPAYNINYPDESCAGDGYQLPDGSNVDATGLYTSNLTSSLGCDSIITVNLVVNPLPEVLSGANASYCPYDGDIVLFPSPEGGELTGDLLDGTTLIHAGAEPGDYLVSYTIVDGNGCSNTDAVNYTLADPIPPSFTFEMICNELALVSTTNDPNESFEYAWYLNDELVALFAESSYFFDQTGTFQLGLTVTDEYGCSYNQTDEVLLQNALDLSGFFVPNVISPNGDDYNQKFIIPSAVSSCLNYTVTIFNRWGQLVYTMTPQSAAFQGLDENGNELPEGSYFYIMEILEYPCAETPDLQEFCTGTIAIFRN